MGLMRRPWKLTNVAVKDMEIHAMGHAAGIVAWMEPESAREAADNIFDFEKCRVEENTRIYSYGGSAGGLWESLPRMIISQLLKPILI